MIDVHTHILPDVDDGSSSVATSIQMLKESHAQGVTDVILTPHARDNHNKTPSELKQAFESFKQIAKEQGVSVNLHLGQEIFVTKDVKNRIITNQVLTINDGKFVLIEPDYTECEITEIVYELTRLGYKPIVAHVERFNYITLEDLYEIKQLGGYVQVNASAVVGKDFRINAKLISQGFKQGLIDFVASDVHANRENCMQKAYKLVRVKYGKQMADACFIQNAKQIINGQTSV